MKRYQHIITISLFVIFGLLSFHLALAVDPVPNANPYKEGIINCDSSFSGSSDGPVRVCDYQAFLDLLGRVFKWLVYLSLPLATLGIGIGGFMLIFGGASESERTRGKTAIYDSIIGFIIVVAAWLLVRTMLVYLGVPADSPLLSLFGT